MSKLEKFNILSKETLDSLDLTHYKNQMFGTIDDVEDKAIVFAESERIKTLNLFDYLNTPVSHIVNNNDGSYTYNNSFYYGLFVLPSKLFEVSNEYTLSAFIEDYNDSGNSDIYFSVVVKYTDETLTEINSDKLVKNERNAISFSFDSSKTLKEVQVYLPRKYNNTTTLTATIKNIILCKSIDYNHATDEYYGEVVHENNENLVFAKLEREKSKNLWDNAKLQSSSVITPSSTGFRITKEATSYGTYSNYCNISLKANVTYTISCKRKGYTTTDGIIFCRWVTTNGSDLWTPNIDKELVNFTPSTDVAKVAFYLQSTQSGGTYVEIEKLQIEEGSVATDYQPYNGAIVHEKEVAGLKGTVLWENPKPTETFAAQTITLSSNDYDFLGIYFYGSVYNGRNLYTEYINDPNSSGVMLDGSVTSQQGASTFMRQCNVNGNNIVWEDSYQATGTIAQWVQNACCVPLKIIGYKRS